MKPAATATRSFVLTHLDVYDWGAFGGRHSAPIDSAGTAIIGPTGSGKTTLVDALMTLLVANPRYNLASTGGHENDRDLVSYVRGVSGAGNDGGGNEHISRPGAVVSAIAARFSDGDSVLRIGGVFWFDGSSSATGDLKRRWLFCQNDAPTLDDWLEAHRDSGARALKDLERRSNGLKVYETRTGYLARLRTHFEVGENAFTLLNRAAGLKQLNSIDVVFRELVLDDRSAFDNAASVVGEFDNLVAIRSELETARRQRDSLLPIASGWAELEKQRADMALLDDVARVLPIWFAQHAALSWRVRHDEIAGRISELNGREQAVIARLVDAELHVQSTHASYLQAGGSNIENLRQLIKMRKDLLASRGRSASDYQATTTALGLDSTLTSEHVQANRAEAARLRPEREAQSSQLKQVAWDRGVDYSAIERQLGEVSRELDEVKRRPDSNIPIPQQDFRRELANHLGIGEDTLPFVAEMVEVKADERRWRGAIERAIGADRLRVLVAPEHFTAALDWINVRNNRLHVRLHDADQDGSTARFFDDGFTRKLAFRNHPLREALKRLLAGIDRHCVSDAAALRTTTHAMTVEGTLSGRERNVDKDDQRSLDHGWMTGFDNRDRITALEGDAKRLADEVARLRADAADAQRSAEAYVHSLKLLDAIAAIEFADIDVAGSQMVLDSAEREMAELLSPSSDTARAERLWKEARNACVALRAEQKEITFELGKANNAIDDASQRLDLLRSRIGNGLDPQQTELARVHLPALDDVAADAMDDREGESARELQEKIQSVGNSSAATGRRLTREMEKAKQADTGALSETGSELRDIPDYLERLRVLHEEALPEKQRRFMGYLTQSSDQGVGQVLGEIDNEVDWIKERISELNATLERVDFQAGHYLQLDPQHVVHESLRTLQKAQANLRSAQMKDDQGESHYRALMDVVALLRDAVDKRRTVGAQALLDPRYRLQFAVLVIDRTDGRVIEKRTSSQGGSGGEKEIIASYVLTASLSYALCPAGSTRPLFGTIVLDEAFSKSSQAVAGRIIRALTEFGLHPLFVTPNKELRLLREHTRSAIVVHRKGQQATMTTLSWEVLEAHARQRSGRAQGADDEVA